ncbi:multisubunit sodium/proton antiporter MrpE subunit [Actinomadura pelletieri DSM 43383]|uniref:Multisubunit sodium/proton antiporter MrpE subunit n=1 Tax=Actinomadura pelletieri DSM 43383 TaxID=1120940 RepID=A0A495QPJ0_9ACTN|nr:Na+/H+ antiporter subunit E [Actinomadura pelletieri]RKS74792.1 multisubunit sodium/proton antiporter MrpE subunit [Actinomadura pelletieri DSM 43383]
MNDGLRRAGARLGMATWLLGVWLLLWGRVDALTLAGGVVAVLVAYVVSRLPTVPMVTRIRPLRLAVAAGEFAWDLLVSSLVIGWHALRAPGRVRGAIVEVEARSRSELVLLAVTTSVSLRPGTLLVDLDWDRSLLRIHGMPVRDPEEADAMRESVLRTERRLMRALVAPDDARRTEDDR